MAPIWRRTLVIGGFAVGIAIVALLAIIAYALLSDENGELVAEVAQPTASATPTPVPTPTEDATPTATPLPPSPTATPEPTPEPPLAALAEEQPPPAQEKPVPLPTEEPPPTTPEPPPPTQQPPLPSATPIDALLQSCLGGSQEACVIACAGGIEEACALVETPATQALFCPPNYTYVASMDGCAPDPPLCPLDFSRDVLDRAMRGECRYPFVLCRVGEEFDALQQKCVPSPPGSPSSGSPASEPGWMSCRYDEWWDAVHNRCVPSPLSCAPTEEYDYLRRRCVPKDD